MAVTLVHCGVGGEEVDVFAAFGIPDEGAGCAGEYDGERVVVVSCEFIFGGDGGVCRWSMVSGCCRGVA